MKAAKYWIVPGLFFLVASILNVTGKVWNPVLAETVKPALMPLLALTAVCAAGGVERVEPARYAAAPFGMLNVFDKPGVFGKGAG